MLFALVFFTKVQAQRFYFTNTDSVVYECTPNAATGTASIYDVTLNGRTNIILPDTVYNGNTAYVLDDIDYGAFQGTDIKSVTIPRSMVSIGYESFRYCDSLTTVTIESDTVFFMDAAFGDCPNLTTLNYNARSTDVYLSSGESVFYECDRLSTINFGPAVRTFTNDASETFDGLSGLRTININSSVVIPITSGFFWHHGTPLTINVPCNMYTAYSQSSAWRTLGTLVADCHPSFETNDTTLGSVWICGAATIGDTVTLYATPKAGNAFVRWSDSVNANPRRLVVPASNDTLTAMFAAPAVIHDTTYIDTLYIYIDTLYTHDTLYIYDTVHDTVYVSGGEGISGAMGDNFKLYASKGDIVVEGTAGATIRVFDINGRTLHQSLLADTPRRISVPATGTYIVRFNNSARKIVIKK